MVVLHLLPRNRSTSLIKGFSILVAGFLVTVITINVLTIKMGLRRKDDVNGMIRYLSSISNDKPLVLLIGASYTNHGIDEDLLAETLEKNNHPVRIARLGYGGMSHMERLNYLRLFLENTKTVPTVALFEISRYYDEEPLLQLEQNLYTVRSIASMDSQGALQGLKYVWSESATDLKKRLEFTRHIFEHWGINFFNIGFLRNFEYLFNAGQYDYRVRDKKTEHLTDEYVNSQLNHVLDALRNQPGQLDPRVPSPWMKGLLDEEMSLLRNYGVRQFMFFSTPSTFFKESLYARDFCHAMTAYPCIQGNAAELPDGLRKGNYWDDTNHLSGRGREQYTRWLAGQLVVTNKLP
jgi:hypothetical protein